MITFKDCKYVYAPDCFGKSDFVYSVDENGKLHKRTLSSVGFDSISFYTTRPSANPTPSPGATATDIFLCSKDTTRVGQIVWNTQTKTFEGSQIYILIRVKLPNEENCVYLFVETIISGTLLQDNCGNYLIDIIYPILLTSNLKVKTLDANGNLIDFDPSIGKNLQCAVHGSLRLQFPEGPINTWLNKNQYFAAAYIKSEI